MKSKRARLISNIDKYFSRYIRIKYSKNEICTCISCWVEKHYKEMHNCHWISRACYLYRWDEDNCRPWCPWCNTYRKEFHMREFTIKQIERMWKKKVDYMRVQAKKIHKLWLPDLRDLLEHWKEKLKNL